MCEYARYTAGTIRQYRTTGHLLRTGMLFQAGYLHDLLGRFLCGSDFIPFDLDFFCVHVRFWMINWGNQPYTFWNQSAVSERYTAQKSASLYIRRRSSSFCPRCIIRRKIIWSCASFENRPIFEFGATSDFFLRFWLVGNNSNCAGGQAEFCIGYLSESRWTHSEKHTANSVALRA